MNISELPYIVARAPMKYGGQQEDYQRRTRDLIAWGARQIKTTPKEEKALVELFFRLIETFSRERQQIARDHRTPKAEQFGRRRDLEGKKDFYHTILDDVYKDYNPKILTFLAERMRDMSLEKKSPVKKSKKLEETYFERLSSIEIEIFENEELARLKWLSPVSLEELPRDFPAHLWEKREKQGDLSSVDWQTLKQGLKKLKEGFPDLYKRLKMSALLLEVQKEFPSPQKIPQPNGSIKLIGNEKNLKSFFVLGTARMPVKGKQYAITQFFTWL